MHGVRSYGFRPAGREKSVESNGPSNRPFQNNVFLMALSKIGQRSIPERPYPAHIVVYQAIIGFIKRSIPDRPFSEAFSKRRFFYLESKQKWKATQEGARLFWFMRHAAACEEEDKIGRFSLTTPVFRPEAKGGISMALSCYLQMTLASGPAQRTRSESIDLKKWERGRERSEGIEPGVKMESEDSKNRDLYSIFPLDCE